MKLIFALGNPETRYDGSRHNVGYWAVDRFASSHGLDWRRATRFKASLAEGSVDGEKVLLAKPETYYNLVGESYRALVNFYKLTPSDVLVIADDLALPLGTIRIRSGGSDAGNNGIKSLNTHGGEDTYRLRIGIASSDTHSIDDADFVLARFNSSERETLDKLGETIDSTIDKFIRSQLDVTTHRHEHP